MAIKQQATEHRPINTLYAGVTDRIIAELEAGRLPWVQPWDSSVTIAGLPCNASSGRAYSGINILILWHALFEQGFTAQRWLTFKQAQALGGHICKGEHGMTVCYADKFTPKDRDGTANESEERRQIAFLKRFTVFNVAQCEGLPDEFYAKDAPALGDRETIPQAEAFIAATGAVIHIGSPHACYMPGGDRIEVPHQQAYPEQINWYRTVLHELGHWSGAANRLDRDLRSPFGSASYAREELIAELCSAFTCAALGIIPTVRHSDYIGSWLGLWRGEHNFINREVSIM